MTALSLAARARLGLASRGRHDPPPPPFSPASIAGLAFWYDAAASPTVETGGVIEQWQDLSGQANHATQAAAGQRPVRVLDGAGREVVRFDGADDALLVDTPPDLATGITAFLVFRMRSRADAAGLLAASDNAVADEASFFAFANGTAASLDLRLSARADQADPVSITGVDSGEIQFAIVTLDGDGGALRDLNGEASDAGTPGVFGVPAAVALGARLNGATIADPAAVDLYEIGLYAGTLSTAQLEVLETYLRGRHGLAWSPLHFGADIAWFHDVHASPFLLSGDEVERWSDLGPGGRDWLQSGTTRPIRTMDGLDRATVRFDGIDDVLALDGAPPALEPFTCAIVCAVRTPGDFAGIVSAAAASGADVGEFWTFQSVDGAPPALSLEGRALEADPLSLSVDDDGLARLALWTTEASAADLAIGANTASDTYDGIFGTPAQIVLGGRFDGAPFGFAAVDVYATLGIGRALTSEERQRLSTWAEARWGL